METCFSHAEGPSEELYMVTIAPFFGRSWVTYRSDPVVFLSCSTRHHVLILGRVHNGGNYPVRVSPDSGKHSYKNVYMQQILAVISNQKVL